MSPSHCSSMMVALLVVATLAAAQLETARLVVETDWELSDEFERGPSRWAYIRNETSGGPMWPDCRNGKAQAPRAMRSGRTQAGLRRIENTWVDSNNFSAINDGVRIRVKPRDVEPTFVDPNTGDVSQLRYIQLQVPAGHTAGGSVADAELALVHGGSSSDTSVPPAVIITVRLEAGYADNAALTWLPGIPGAPARDSRTGQTAAPTEAVFRQVLNVDGLLPPAPREYLRYVGSELSPPCREGVVHYVLRQPLRMSYAQLATLRSKLHVHASLRAGWPPRVARASRPAVPPTRSSGLLERYVLGREHVEVAVPDATEAVTTEAGIALAALCLSGVTCLCAVLAFLVALCYPRADA